MCNKRLSLLLFLLMIVVKTKQEWIVNSKSNGYIDAEKGHFNKLTNLAV